MAAAAGLHAAGVPSMSAAAAAVVARVLHLRAVSHGKHRDHACSATIDRHMSVIARRRYRMHLNHVSHLRRSKAPTGSRLVRQDIVQLNVDFTCMIILCMVRQRLRTARCRPCRRRRYAADAQHGGEGAEVAEVQTLREHHWCCAGERLLSRGHGLQRHTQHDGRSMTLLLHGRQACTTQAVLMDLATCMP